MNAIFSKILTEEKIYENEFFFIVKDSDPIVENHLLLFYREEIASFSSVNNHQLEIFLQEFVMFSGTSFFYFEAGNNTFCSTFEGNYIAHAHLIPSEHLYNFSLELDEKCNIEETTSFSILRKIRTNDQYLFWGEIGKKYKLVYPSPKCTKRFFRNNIQAFISNGKN